MNQILFTNNNNNNKVDIQKIIKIFCILIILIAFIIMAIKVYGLYETKKNETNNKTPAITVTRADAEVKEITIKATCKDGIQSIGYTWNEEKENKVLLNGSTSFERIIEIPQKATNTLKVTVTSINGITSEKTEIITLDIDNNKPIIDATIANNKLSIKVSDDSGIKYLAYKWENEEEIIVNANEEEKEMATEIDIARGTYKLQIRVVDIYENEETITKLITGVNEPEISVIKFGNKVKVSVTHDKGFKQIEYIINDSKYLYDEKFSKYDKNKTTIELEFPLEEGENIVQITAYSLEKLSEEAGEELNNYAFKKYTGRCTYEP